MTWEALDTFSLNTNQWQFSQPVSGNYFKLRHSFAGLPQKYFTGLVCQAELDAQGNPLLYDVRPLKTYSYGEVVHFTSPDFFAERRIGLKRSNVAMPTTTGNWEVELEQWVIPSDPHFNKVVLLLHCDGTDGSTAFSDVKGKTVTANGNAEISTAESKFGGASSSFNVNQDLLFIPTSPDFDLSSGDFTLEQWVRFNSSHFFTSFFNFQLDPCLYLFYESIYVRNHGNEQLVTPASHGMSLDTWHHIALVRAGTNYKVYRDGEEIASGSGGTVSPGNKSCEIGPSNPNGYIDEIRITKGFARYLEDFDPPIEPFLDS